MSAAKTYAIVSLSCVVAALASPVAARAQAARAAQPKSAGEADPPEATPPTVKAPSADTTAIVRPTGTDPQSAARQAAMRLAEFDALKTQGQTTDFPGVGQTLTKDAGGVRSWLYDHDLYFRGVVSNNLTKDVSGNSISTGGQQTYTGQTLTFSQNNEVRLSWKVGGSGNDITQINVGGLFSIVNWRQLGPSGARFSNLTVFHSFLDRTIEIKAGYNQNLSDFVGIFAGGNPILASGVAGSIPLSTGMSGAPPWRRRST